MTPNTGTPFSTKAIFTVNSPFFLINSLVPSSGSTIHSVSHLERSLNGISFPSSLKTGNGVTDKAFVINRWAALSAFVNGELSAFLSIPKSDSGSL